MVKKQRRMTVKKNSKKPSARSGGAERSTIRASAKATKVGVGRSSPKGKRPAQTDRASQAQKTLIKAIQKMEEKE